MQNSCHIIFHNWLPIIASISFSVSNNFNNILCKKEHDSTHAHQNSEVAVADKGMEICGICFSCCWTGLLCSKLFLQLSIWKLEFVEDNSLHCFQFYHLHHDFV